MEILNDRDGELVNFWRIIQVHLLPFMDYFKWAVVGRKFFDWENKKIPETLTDIQRAVRYYYLQRLGFGGKTINRTFGSGATRPMNMNLTTMEETLLEVHQRLQRVTIENLDACACITRYDRPETFFYIDPPYYHVAQDYAVQFSDADFVRLRETLRKVNGRFLLSLNDVPDVRKTFSCFSQDRVVCKYSSGNSRVSADTRGKDRRELFIHNLK